MVHLTLIQWNSMPLFTALQYPNVRQIVQRLGDAPMKRGSHGYGKHKGKTIAQASRAHLVDFVINARIHPAIALMDVVLAANRDYNKQVIRHVERMRDEYPDLTFKKLGRMLSTKYPDARSFKEVWGHNDARKYAVLTTLVERINRMNGKAKFKADDFAFMSKWVAEVSLALRHLDPLTSGNPYFAFASFQHLRMTFGADTVKPDRRVKQVLLRDFSQLRDFGGRISDEKTVLAVEEIAAILDCRILTIDQIFVKYGSGHYAVNDRTVKTGECIRCPRAEQPSCRLSR